MSWSILYWLQSFVTGAMAAYLAGHMWPHRALYLAKTLILIMIFISIWSLAYAFEYLSHSLGDKLFWIRVESLGAVWVAPAFFVLAMQFRTQRPWLTRPWFVLLAIIPLLLIILVWTNPAHQLMWSRTWLVELGSTRFVTYDRGPGFWLFASYSYFLLVIGTIVLVGAYIRARHLYRRQLGVVLIGLSAPWLTNIVYLTGITPLPHMDLTPLSFTITGLAIAWGLFRFQLLDLKPIAREAVMAGLNDGVIIFDTDNRVVDVNPGAQGILGIEASPHIGRRLPEKYGIRPEPFENEEEFTPVSKEVVLQTPDGERLFEQRQSHLCDRRGQPVGSFLVLRDITQRKLADDALRQAHDGLEAEVQKRTAELEAINRELIREIAERKNAEEALRASERRYRLLADNVDDIIWTVDAELKCDYVSPSIEKMLGYKVEESLGQSMDRVLSESSKKLAAQQMNENLTRLRQEGLKPFPLPKFRYEMIHKDGRSVWVEVQHNFLLDDQGRVNGLLGVTRDITDRKQNEDELRQAKEAADAANRAKSQFLANMSHEIRTPMNAIVGMTALALDSSLSPEQREYLEAIRGASRHMLVLIDDILDVSRIEAGKIRLQETEFQVRATLDQILKSHLIQAEKKCLKLFYQVNEDVPGTLVGDVSRLRQVIVNLVNNAIKFTEDGEVRIHLGRRDGHIDPDLLLDFEITDTGIGIPRENLDSIFHPFTQVDTSSVRKYGGAGLGLAISNKLVEMMGGEMWVKSEPGKGSTFGFCVHFKPGPARGDEETPPGEGGNEDHQSSDHPIEGLKILVAEDNPVNQKLAVVLLKKRGHEALVAENGREVLRALEREDFDMILMDVQMPEMDGFEATLAIRRLERTSGNHIPIVAMTAHAMSGDRERCLAHGMDEYLAKPIEPKRLYQVVERIGRSLSR